jgi:hypothetical protein
MPKRSTPGSTPKLEPKSPRSPRSPRGRILRLQVTDNPDNRALVDAPEPYSVHAGESPASADAPIA